MLQKVREVDLERLAHVAANHIDFWPLNELGWIPMSMKMWAMGDDGVPMSVLIYYDEELGRTMARHE